MITEMPFHPEAIRAAKLIAQAWRAGKRVQWVRIIDAAIRAAIKQIKP
jgi:hypothetical protein